MLRLAELGFLLRMPADGRGIKENVRALESREPGGFGIPLIPADEDADSTEAGVERSKARPPHPRPGAQGHSPQGRGGKSVAGREVILLIIKRIVGDVHLAKDAEERAVGVEDRGRIMIDA